MANYDQRNQSVLNQYNADSINVFLRQARHDKAWDAAAPDMPVSNAINYIVNDSTASLKAPRPQERFTRGRLGKWAGIGHLDAAIKIQEEASSGRLKVWGRKEKGGPGQWPAYGFEAN